MSNLLSPAAWIAVSRSALRHNYAAVRSLLALDASPPRLISVVKANAFGHGAVETARILEECSADFFAVTTPLEALELRDAGITSRILVFLPPLLEQIPLLIEAELDLTISDEAGLRTIAEAAQRCGQVVRVHLKVDTGMGRLGVLPGESLLLAAKLDQEKSLHLAGTYTHFARSLEESDAATRKQFQLFQAVLAEIENAGIDPGLRHCANSAATLRFPEMRLDAVRPGTILYGQYPAASVPRTLDLKETWRMQARLVSVRQVPAGTAIGYGGEFVTRRASTLAVLPLGYADGFGVAPSSATAGWRGLKALLRPRPITVSLGGRQAPVVGRISMQLCTVDVTDIPGVAAGDVVTASARRILASARLPRVYEERFP